MVWDEGTYESLEETNGSKAAQEKALLKGLREGSLKFRLNGHKLKGEFALVRTKGRGENSWLLIKHRDRYASEKPVTDKDKSVVSKKTLEQIEKDPKAREWESNRSDGKARRAKKVGGRKAGAGTNEKAGVGRATNGKAGVSKAANGKAGAKTGRKKEAGTVAAPAAGRRAAMPQDVSPMLATLVDKPFDEEGWLYEIKWDGFRTLAYLNKGKVELRSRNNKSFEKYYPIYDELKEWSVNAVLDGELVVLDAKGQSNFGALQNWRSEADGELIYYVFDVLWLEGRDLTGLPLTTRRELLRQIIPAEGSVRYSDNFETSGTEFFAAAQKMGLEGIIAKKADSPYIPGARTREWLKVKTVSRQEVVLGGYTRNKGTSKPFSSLLAGVFENGRLQYVGKIGTGFNVKMQKEMMKQFKPLEQKEAPFDVVPDVNSPSRFRPDPPEAKVVWLKPRLVCEVSYREMTRDGIMRQPSFEGMREDKDAREVVRERPLETGEAVQEKPAEKKRKEADVILQPVKQGVRKTLLNPTDETQTRNIGGHDLHFTNLSKIFWPKEKYTKRDLLNYYYQVAPYILPYMKDRPQSLNRHPNGINGKSFYQKNVSGKVPDWIETFPYHSKEDNEDKEFLVCTDEASLMYIISLGCIEVNPWSSRVKAPDNPDWCIIDLDPGKRTPFEKVIEAAQVTRKVLDAAGIDSYPKTSGSTGIHIYFPLGAKYSYEESKEFARVVVHKVNAEIPDFTSIERTVSARRGKMYLDFLQNRPQATIAAPYAVRPKPGATVSAPLRWEEVKKGLSMQDFTIRTMIDRVKDMGDVFKPVLGKGINMEKALKALNAL
jgi:bifunctional non-homologous end joining protein LigD